MPTLTCETTIAVPPERCFDLARDIGLHCLTCDFTDEKAVAGVTSGPIEMGQTVTFEARHLGVRQRLTSRITAFERPKMFVDEMERGAFASLRHIHEFEPSPHGTGTIMRDIVTWTSPLGPLGHIADALFVKRHMTRFLARRNANFKALAESKDLQF